MPSILEKIKETVILTLLNIILPSVDVYSDFGLIYVFFRGSRHNPYCDQEYEANNISWAEKFNCYYDDNVPTSNLTFTPHVGWGTLMLLPFLLNYLICWYMWATTDKRKMVTWLAALLSFYPQFVACKIISQIWWGDLKRGLQKKRHLERDLIQLEVFYEAVPSVLVMTYLMMRATGRRAKGSEIILNGDNMESTLLFFVAYFTSIITSSLGLAKNLKVGPCRILPEQKKYLRGFLSPRFVLLFFACGFTLVGKGVALAIAVIDSGPCRADPAVGAAIAVSTFFLPGFLISIFACWHRGILKTFLAHPSIFLLPVFTHFTFVSNLKPCSRGEGGEKSFISFSPKYTAINAAAAAAAAGVSAAGILAYFCSRPLSLTVVIDEVWRDWFYCISAYLIFGLPCSILGLIFTLMATFSNQCNCYESSCCCLCCCEPFEFGALVTSSPNVLYILGPDGQLVREGELEKNKEEELEMEESKDLIPSSSKIVLKSEMEVNLDVDTFTKEGEEAHFSQMSVHIY